MLDELSEGIADSMRRCLQEIQFANTTQTTNQTIEGCDQALLNQIEKYVKPLWQTDFPVAFLYCCLVSVALLVGTSGNIIILVVNLTRKTVNSIGKAFIVNLALADLCVTAVAEPMCLIGVIKGEKWIQSRWWLCELVASLCLSACFCAFLSLTAMTLNRYVYVCHHNMYNRIFNRYVCFLLCVVCWVLGFIFEFPNFVGWGDHYFDQKNHQCIWDRTASLSYTLLVAIGLIGGPLLICAVCFVLIFIKIWRSKMDVYTLNSDDPLRMRRVWMESLRASRTLAIIFVAFVVCWTPYAVVIATDVNNEFSMEVHLFVTLLAHLHSSLNFTIYMASNKNFRQSVSHMLCCVMVPSWMYSSSDSGKTLDTTKTENSSRVDSKSKSEIIKKPYYIDEHQQNACEKF